MTAVEAFHRSQSTVCGYASRYLDELARLEAGEGSNEATILALELLRAAVKANEEARQVLMTEVTQ